MEISKLIMKRYSPFAFSEKEISDQDLQRFLEAARWAASSSNEQPWRFLIASKKDKPIYEKLFECLFEDNKLWAKSAPVLMLIMAKRNYTRNNKPNPTHMYDTGLAVQNFILTALESDVQVHQMGGFTHDIARKNFNITEEYSLISVSAMGYLGDISHLPEEIKRKAQRPRIRKPIADSLF